MNGVVVVFAAALAVLSAAGVDHASGTLSPEQEAARQYLKDVLAGKYNCFAEGQHLINGSGGYMTNVRCEDDQAPAAGTSSQSEGITVFGTLKYTPWSGYGVTVEAGVPHAYVCVYDYDESDKYNLVKRSAVSKTDGSEACAYTDSTGYFSIPDVNPDDPNDDGSRIDIVMRFFHITDEHGKIVVQVGSAENVSFDVTYHTLGDDKTEFDASHTFSSNTQQNHAFGVYDAIHDALSFFGVADDVDNPIVVVAGIGNNKCDKIEGKPSHCYFWNADVIGIGRTYGDASDRWTVLHEMGHWVMSYSMGEKLFDGGEKAHVPR